MDVSQGHALEEILTRTSNVEPLPRRKSHLEVRIAVDEDSERDKNSSGSSGRGKEEPIDVEGQKPKERQSNLRKQVDKASNWLAPHFAWIAPNNIWSKWKPVIRCALAAWISGILFIVPTTENAMGQVCSPSPSRRVQAYVLTFSC